MKNIYLLAVLFLFSIAATAQQIISVTPSSTNPGTKATVLITTADIFLSGNVTVDFGAGITVDKTEVIQAQMVRAHVTVNAAATLGMRTITLTANGQTLQYDNFEVASSGGAITAMIDVIPVQKIYLTDLDPNNAALAPLLFNVTVMNDGVQRSIVVKLTIEGNSTGIWGTAVKSINNMQPNAVLRFNNKEFDTYKINTGNKPSLEEAAKNGKLPADIYEYQVELFDPSGNKITETSGRNVIDNPVARPELISPGNPLTMQPEVVYNKLPFFQWFSQAPTHTITVYPVFNGQLTREEISLNRPVWTQTNVATKNTLYPASAEVLENGKTYAWQVTGIISGVKGQEQLFSDVYWFTVSGGDKKLQPIAYSQLVITPAAAAVQVGTVTNFKIYGIDENNVRYDITDKTTWKVIPSGFGTISNGTFTAGRYPENVAVVAQYGEEQVFADIVIEPANMTAVGGWDMDAFMRQLFGIK